MRQLSADIEIELLNYNPLAENKFRSLDQPYLVDQGTKPLSLKEFNRKKALMGDILGGKNID